jgi:hypothetical protein
VSSTATLNYSATAQGPVVPSALEAAMAAVSLDFAEIEAATGCTLTSDVTTVSGGIAARNIVFDINHPRFQAEFPAGTDQASPFRGLYKQVLAIALSCPIVEIPVVIA